MGGRGASSGAGGGSLGGAKITFNGQTTTYYFYQKGNESYFQRGVSGSIEPIPGGMSAKEFVNRAKSNGADVKSISAKEARSQQDAHRQERANRPDYELGYGTGNMRDYARRARRNALATRAMKRK